MHSTAINNLPFSSQVNWPKLNTPEAASEGFLDALARAQSDRVVGYFLPAGGHQRGVSTARLGHMEEGKKRIE